MRTQHCSQKSQKLTVYNSLEDVGWGDFLKFNLKYGQSIHWHSHILEVKIAID